MRAQVTDGNLIAKFRALRTTKRYMSVTTILFAVWMGFLWFFGERYGYISAIEGYTVPTLAVVSGLLAILFLTLSKEWDIFLLNIFKAACGITVLGGLIEAGFSAESNIEYYLITLSPYYLVLMFSDLSPRSVIAGYSFFAISSITTLLALYFGPYTIADRQFILLATAIFGQLNIVVIFAVLKKIIIRARFDKERTESLEEAARLSEEVKEEAIEASKLKSQFLANMSHELRTPLNAILGFSELVMKLPRHMMTPAKVEEYNSLIHQSGSHLLELVNDLLDMAKIEAGKMELWEREIRLEEMVCEVFVMLEPLYANKKLTVHTSGILPYHTILADQRMVRQIIQNLTSNAIKYNKSEGEITATSVIDDNGQLVLTISDTGVGMRREELSHLSVPFSHGRRSGRGDAEGTGLGLYLVRVMMELHGGSLDIASEVGKGTQASVIFPAERVVRSKVVDIKSIQSAS